ncbi:hypothetical protein GJR96_15865 [Haloferax sp. MBLA0076]|uniref:Uncharacterized protein n=1 Tax=Haloferax litoreum TaxID=2666140 RepID=A0A6A8GKQ2_9EURY|nr:MULTISPECIES: hypothetical protein [Haloferax]KAB1190454.1 hypothetical protein Hfx1148_15795 [Haloferax sp. CBA1148]MRX23429.1 hypothetical protein [Haloferax litoreum]
MLRGHVIDIVPGAGYQGVVYDQWVVVQSSNNTELKVFDNTVLVASDVHVGRECELTLLAQPSKIEQKAEPPLGIDIESQDDIILTGRVIDTAVRDIWHPEPDRPLLALDVGAGEVLVTTIPELGRQLDDGDVTIGDYLQVVAYRVDLLEIETLSSES